jgi:hypothetical protein
MLTLALGSSSGMGWVGIATGCGMGGGFVMGTGLFIGGAPRPRPTGTCAPGGG